MGMKPNDNKVKAVVNIPETIDKDGVGLIRPIGMLNWLLSFIPN